MTRKTIRNALFAIFLSGMSGLVFCGESSQGGVIFDHTSVPGGLLIRFDPAVTPMPENCAGASSNWMFISESNKIIVAVTLMVIAANNRAIVVYTSGIGSNGYCAINQVDPQG